MSIVVAFDVKVVKDDAGTKFTFVLKAEGDTFEVECDNPGDLIDEVDELLNEKLAPYTFTMEDA